MCRLFLLLLLLLLSCTFSLQALRLYDDDDNNVLNLAASCPTETCSLWQLQDNLQHSLRYSSNDTQPQLQQLLLFDLQARIMPGEILMRTPNLRVLLIQNSTVHLILPIRLRHVPHLRELQMQQTHLSSLLAQHFAHLTELEVLQLNHNMIQFVHATAFAGLGRLQLLALRGNGIVELPKDTFAGLGNLTHLDLSGNEISQLDAKTFAGNLKLQTLLLNDNKLLQLEARSLLHLTQLHLLDLNRAGRVEELQLNGAQRVQVEECGLKRLIIEGSVISLKAANNELTELSIADKRSPLELDLQGNQLTGNATSSLLQGMWHLQRLDLSKNNIDSLSSNLNQRLMLPSLVQLNLAHNQLSRESSTELPLLLPSSLVELDISFNHMFNVRATDLAGLPNLQRLYMDGIRLAELDYSVFHKQHMALQELGICDQDFALMRKLSIYFKDRAVHLPLPCQLHSGEKTVPQTHMEMEEPVAQPQASVDLAGVCGIHPYWTLRDILAFITLLVVMCILLLQLYNILEEEGCLRRWRQWCTGQRRRGTATVNGQRNRRLNEEDSEV